MIKKLAVVVFLFSGFFAQTAFASVRLNEIAWMGTEVSGANEWIELYNDGLSSVDLTGWRIEAQDGSPNILLSGAISPSGYFLIERTDDTTVSNIPGDVVASFGNGLINSGETLLLKDANGSIVETVTGGANWVNIGGDSTTKQTAQRLLLGNSWITATGTPRAENVSSGEIAGASTAPSGTSGTQTSAPSGNTSSNTEATTQGGGVSKSVYPVSIYPRKEMTVLAGADQRAFTGFPVTCSGQAMGLYDETLPYATYRWNFGDGATGEGSKVSHVYSFPGEYTATLEAVYGSLKNTDRILIVVTDPDVVIAGAETGENGYIQLSNRTPREIDLSGWSLVSRGTDVLQSKTFFFAPNTIVLSGKSVRFPYAVTQLDAVANGVELHAPNGTLVHEFGSFNVTAQAGVVAGMTTTRHSEPSLSPTRDIAPPLLTATAANPLALKSPPRGPIAIASGTAATVLWERTEAPEAGRFSEKMKWFFAFMGLLLMILAGFIIVRSRVDEATIADEYAIIEDIIESEADLIRKSKNPFAE